MSDTKDGLNNVVDDLERQIKYYDLVRNTYHHNEYEVLIYELIDHIRALEQQVSESKKKFERLADAVNDLPVEEWVEQDGYGDPCLIGYTMQAQGEWDAVRKVLEKTNN